MPTSFHRFPSKKLLAWFANVARPLPWRIKYEPYHVLLSEMMLQQTQVVTALPYYHRWLEKWPDWQALAQASEAEVLKMWEGLGYYQRARRLLELAQMVAQEYNGTLPSNENALAQLPGFGPYTVAAVSAIAFNQVAFPIDGNVRRVLARFIGSSLLSPSNEQDEIFKTMMLPEFNKVQQRRDLAQAMMELGALVCTPKKPLCGQCPLQKDCHCATVEKALLYPVKKDKAKAKVMHLAYVWLKTTQGYALRQRPAKGRFPSQWEPVVVEAGSEEEAKTNMQALLGMLGEKSTEGPKTPRSKVSDSKVNTTKSRQAPSKIDWRPGFRRDFTTYHVTWHEGYVCGHCLLEGYEFFSEVDLLKLNLVPVMAKTWTTTIGKT